MPRPPIKAASGSDAAVAAHAPPAQPVPLLSADRHSMILFLGAYQPSYTPRRHGSQAREAHYPHFQARALHVQHYVIAIMTRPRTRSTLEV